jgi:carboxylesterase
MVVKKSDGAGKWHWKKRMLVGVASVILLLTLGIFGYSWNASRELAKEVESTPRDPETGIVIGAEPINLGPPDASAACLLLHGYVGSRADFSDLGERLSARGFHVRMARLPGHGTTPDDFLRQTPDSMIKAAVEELNALRSSFEHVYVIGFSMGGAISTLLTAENSVDGLVLVSPFYKVTYFPHYVLPPEIWNRMFSSVIPYVIKTEHFIKVNKRESIEHLFSYRAIPTQGVKTLMELGRRARNPDVLGRIDCPVLVIHCRGDEAASPDATALAFESIGSDDKEIRWFTKRSNHHLLSDYDAEDAKELILSSLDRMEHHP